MLGLDVRSSGILLAQLRQKRGGYLVEKLLTDTSTLTTFVQRYQLKGQPVAVCVPQEKVGIETIHVPKGLTEAEIEAEIAMVVRRDWPSLKEEHAMDFMIRPAKHHGYLEVLFAIANQAYVSAYVQRVEEAGLAVGWVDVDTFAVKRAAEAAIVSKVYLSNTVDTRIIKNQLMLSLCVCGLAMRSLS